ncbi:sel1 repeat family protein [Amantichitinum ursilacus]|uniref:Sel1 repeat protein n=1 Tax=Amantichitinum ursilacus TaxID=857265 RepID=A0A0N0XM02_9NEIS|nr:sel1 repeat family protein [Amantichitinum ursilacus]KPC53754.1 Sel1 repeat protein [Amantichitinum ursilacus]
MMRTMALACVAALALGGCVSVQQLPAPDISALSDTLPRAEQGDAAAQYQLGATLGYNYRALKRDDDTGFSYLLASAEQGNAQAQVTVAQRYLNRINGDLINNADGGAAARYWLLRAAAQNSHEAYAALARWNGAHYQPPQSRLESCKWGWLAWQACPDNTLSAEQIETAHRQAQAWAARLDAPAP